MSNKIVKNIYIIKAAMVKCFYCERNHSLNKCNVSKEDLHYWLIKQCIKENFNLLYFRNNLNLTSFHQKIHCLSIRQCRLLLNDCKFLPKYILLKRVYKKYKKLSINLLQFNVDYPSFHDRLIVNFNRSEDEQRIIDETERQLSYMILEMQYLNNGEVNSFIQNIPNIINNFISSRQLRIPIREPSSPSYPPPSYEKWDIKCLECNMDDIDFHCCICDENNNSENKTKFSCNHDYCFSCVMNFLTIIQQPPNCPLCRRSVDEIRVSNKYFQEKMEKTLKKKG